MVLKERDFVVPGDEIVKSIEFLPGKNCFREGESIYSKRIGLVHIDNRVISVIPLVGVYTPYRGDMVIGEIEDIQPNGWIINIDTINTAYLSLSGVRGFVRQGSDLTRIYNIGDIVYAKILSANKVGFSITMQDIRCRKLIGGKIIKVNPAKVPRIIGKKGSMITMIKYKTGCNIVAGQNGIIWIQGDNDNLVTEAIRKIEKESSKEGLTDEIEKFLSKQTLKKEVQLADKNQQKAPASKERG